MEDRRDDNNAEYTGEYGNVIKGEYTEDTTYRYTYDRTDESTHSGDYYAGTEETGDDTARDSDSDVQSNRGAETAEDANVQQTSQHIDGSSGSGAPNGGSVFSGQNQASNGNTGFTGQNQASNGSTGFTGQNQTSNGNAGFTGQNQTYYNGNAGFGGQNQMPQNRAGTYYAQPPKPPKKQASFGKKILISAVCAVVFGLVAGAVFNGYRFFSAKLGGIVGDSTTLEKTTVQSGGSKEDKSEKEQRTDTVNQANQKDVAAIAEETMPAVVAITSTTQGADYFDLFGQYYQGREATSSGTGFIVGQNDKELLIATNNHVVDDAKTISVQFIDGEVYEAKEKGSDSSNDLAVVAVNVSSVKKATMDKIKIADMGNSDKAKVGEMVIAIGNALGYGQSVTVGYISAKDREIAEADESGKATGNKIKALQTDAAINPGNSGGALINMQGQVIGINSAKIASSSVEGVGYAIPITVATPIIDELMNKEILSDDEKGYLGISGAEVTEEASVFDMPYGVYVKEVAKGGAADKGGVKVGDVITAVNKMEVTNMTSLQEKVNSYRKGTKVELTIKRNSSGKYQEKKVKVELQGKESLDSLSGNDTTGSKPNNGNNGSRDGNGNSGNGNNTPDNGSGNGGSGSLWDFFQ